MVRRIALDDLEIVRVDGATQDDLVLFLGRGDRHVHGFCQRGGAVVHRCVGHIHVQQCRDQRLEFIDDLQGALRNLGLVRGICRKQLAAQQQLGNRRRRIVPV